MRATCGEVPFENLVRFMQKCSEVPAKQKEQVFLHFLDKSVPRPSPDIFQIFRLLLPAVSVTLVLLDIGAAAVHALLLCTATR
jgi:hypothetical protein